MRDPSPPFHLTPELRIAFKEVTGELIQDPGLPALFDRLRGSELPIASIGDTTTLNMISVGLVPDLAIVDFGTRRGKLNERDIGRLQQFLGTGKVMEIENPPETIMRELWENIKEFYTVFYNKFKIRRPGRMGTTPVIIRIIGEEDLASLPCVYFAEKGGHVLYGLPGKGLIHIQVNETQRTIVRDALMMMEALNGTQDNQSDR